MQLRRRGLQLASPLGARSKSAFADRRRPIDAPMLPIAVASQAAAAGAVPAGRKCAAPDRPSRAASQRCPVLARHCATPSSTSPAELATRKIIEATLTTEVAETTSLITATFVASRSCPTATSAAALESGMAKPTLKPITLTTPPARANQGDLRREAQATASTAGSTVSENAKPSHSANCSRAGSPDTPASTAAKSSRIPNGEIKILAAMRRPGSGTINARMVRHKPRKSRGRAALALRSLRPRRSVVTAVWASAFVFVLLMLIPFCCCGSGITSLSGHRHRPGDARPPEGAGDLAEPASGLPPCG